MSYRQICLTFLTSVFILSSTPALQAMKHDDDEDNYSNHSYSNSSACACASDSDSDSEEGYTPEELQLYKQIKRVRNYIPELNSDLDEIQLLLTSPVKAEVSYSGNSTIFLAILENGTKVLLKKSMIKGTETHYSLQQAMAEFIAPKIARAYFDSPTLLPTEFISGEDGYFEVRQYFIDGELGKGDLELQQIHNLIGRLQLYPQTFNRQCNFLFDLDLFDDFVAAKDRNITNFFWILHQTPRFKQQNLAFFAIDYAETFYDSFEGIVNKEYQEDSVGSLCNLQPITLLSSLKKLDYLHKIYPSFFKEAEALMPGIGFFEHRDSPFAIDNSRYFEAMATWHQDLFMFYQGYTVDDMNASWVLTLKSHELNKK